mmetsp:Transcript_88166/g.175039  ORF Transcript_88166/g.175039 Transcript_88166/m.175039 type:complete len:208 (-) Transcript_88166:176-799(-)
MVSAHATSFSAQGFDLRRHYSCSSGIRSLSLKSSFVSMISTPSSPIRSSFILIAAINASTSCFLSVTKSPWNWMASSSARVASARCADIVSGIFSRIRMICPDCDAKVEASDLARKDVRASRSASASSTSLWRKSRRICAESVCKNPPATPSSKAATACTTAFMVESNSAFWLAMAAASFVLMVLALAIASSAAILSDSACSTSLLS